MDSIQSLQIQYNGPQKLDSLEADFCVLDLERALEKDKPEIFNGIREYFNFYNYKRPHQGLKDKRPFEIHSA